MRHHNIRPKRTLSLYMKRSSKCISAGERKIDDPKHYQAPDSIYTTAGKAETIETKRVMVVRDGPGKRRG